MLPGAADSVAEVAMTAGAPVLGEFRLQVGPSGAADAGIHRNRFTPAARPPRAPAGQARGRVEARRHPGPGAPRTAPRSPSSPAASTTSPRGARGGRGRPRAARPGRLVLDGEALRARAGRPSAAVPGDGEPRRRRPTRPARPGVPLTLFFFDVLHLDGADLLDAPLAERLRPARRVAARRAARSRGWSTADAAGGARRSSPRRVAAGHEGVVVKSLDAPYDAGRRGAAG